MENQQERLELRLNSKILNDLTPSALKKVKIKSDLMGDYERVPEMRTPLNI